MASRTRPMNEEHKDKKKFLNLDPNTMEVLNEFKNANATGAAKKATNKLGDDAVVIPMTSTDEANAVLDEQVPEANIILYEKNTDTYYGYSGLLEKNQGGGSGYGQYQAKVLQRWKKQGSTYDGQTVQL